MLCSQDSCFFWWPRLQSNEKLPENCCGVCCFPFSFETHYALTVVYRLSFSLRAQWKTSENSEPVTWPWACTVPCRNTYAKKAYSDFLELTLRVQLFFAGKQKHIMRIKTSQFSKRPVRARWFWGSTRVERAREGSEWAQWVSASTMVWASTISQS